MLHVRDSYCKRPFLAIGLDLLIEMGINELHFFTIPRDWSSGEDRNYEVREGSHARLCGCQMHMESGGFVHLDKKEERTVHKTPDIPDC